MFGRLFPALLAFGLAACTTASASDAKQAPLAIPPDQQAFLDTCEPWDKWDKPAPPFKVHGSTYYVGTCGISSILIVGDGEHILIDSGTEKGAETVLRNIKTLGVDLNKIKFLAYSHEHFDHVGGHALIQEATGASVIARKQIAPVFETGVVLPNDPQFGMHEPMKPAKMGMALESLKGLSVSGLSIRAIETPGHSPGAMTWYWNSCDQENGSEVCRSIIYADSLSPVSRDDYKFSDHPNYLAEYRAGLVRLARQERFERLRTQQCNLLLTPHPSHSRMIKRMEAGKLIPSALSDQPCTEYAAGKMRDLDKRLAKEAAQ